MPSRSKSIADAVFDQRAIGQRRDPPGRPSLALNAQRPAPVMLEREGDIGPRHRQAANDIEAGGIFAARASAGTCAAPAPSRTALDPHARAGRHRRRPLPAATPLSISIRQPSSPRTRLSSVSCATLAIEGSASPRNPSVATASIASSGSFDVAWRSSASAISPRRHPAAVVDHFDAVDAAAGESHRNFARAGVDGVLDQLLQGAGRAFDNLARGDAIDQMFGQAAY